VVLDVLDPPCVCTFICLEIKEHRNSRAAYVPEGSDDTGSAGQIFFIFSWRRSDSGAQKARFFVFDRYSSALSVLLTTKPYESMTGPMGPRVLSYLRRRVTSQKPVLF
jgi:hypothetical protein